MGSKWGPKCEGQNQMPTPTTTPAAELVARLNADDPKWLVGDDADEWQELSQRLDSITEQAWRAVSELYQRAAELDLRAGDRIAAQVEQHELGGFDPCGEIRNATYGQWVGSDVLGKLHDLPQSLDITAL